MRVFLEHAPSRRRCDQLGYYTADIKRWHDFKAFIPALQLCAQRHLANTQILVVQEDGVEVRLDLPDDTEFSFPSLFQPFSPSSMRAH
jgi:hypothetical protein